MAADLLPLVYVAGPYSAPTCWGRQVNIHRARVVGAHVAMAGASPVIPHANTANMDGIQSHEWWLRATLSMLARCHAMVVLPHSQDSHGTQAEIEYAEAHGIPYVVLSSMADLVSVQSLVANL